MPLNIILKSLGNQSASLTSIQISGPNATDFTESDNCMTSPVLPTNHTCVIAVTYAPAATGTSQASLVISDNASGSPQQTPLSGTAVAAPPPAAVVTLNPANAPNFPGTTTQGISSPLPENIVLTNSGNASLQISSAMLSGSNSADFSISSNNCSGTLAANSSRTISIVFSPLAPLPRCSSRTAPRTLLPRPLTARWPFRSPLGKLLNTISKPCREPDSPVCSISRVPACQRAPLAVCPPTFRLPALSPPISPPA